MLDHSGSSPGFPTKERVLMPAIQSYIIEPIWEQFSALLP